MATAIDVARYICEKIGKPVTAMKLQKLVYYSQAWHLVWDEAPLFENRIEAWANGPVVPDLFYLHKGQFNVDADTFKTGDLSRLSDEDTATIDAVIAFYGDSSSAELSDLTHSEDPWKKARERACVDSGDRCTEEILVSEMAEYYESL